MIFSRKPRPRKLRRRLPKSRSRPSNPGLSRLRRRKMSHRLLLNLPQAWLQRRPPSPSNPRLRRRQNRCPRSSSSLLFRHRNHHRRLRSSRSRSNLHCLRPSLRRLPLRSSLHPRPRVRSNPFRQGLVRPYGLKRRRPRQEQCPSRAARPDRLRLSLVHLSPRHRAGLLRQARHRVRLLAPRRFRPISAR